MVVFSFSFLLVFNLSICNVALAQLGAAGGSGGRWGWQQASATSPAVLPANHLGSRGGEKAKSLFTSFQAQQCML